MSLSGRGYRLGQKSDVKNASVGKMPTHCGAAHVEIARQRTIFLKSSCQWEKRSVASNVSSQGQNRSSDRRTEHPKSHESSQKTPLLRRKESLGDPLRSILDLISAARCTLGSILIISGTLLAPSQTVLELL